MVIIMERGTSFMSFIVFVLLFTVVCGLLDARVGGTARGRSRTGGMR